jgi:hypothetical protein
MWARNAISPVIPGCPLGQVRRDQLFVAMGRELRLSGPPSKFTGDLQEVAEMISEV